MDTNIENKAPATQTRKYDGTVALLLAGSIYLLLGIAFNWIFKTYLEFTILALISSLLGLYAAVMLIRGQASKATIVVSLTAIGIGLAITLYIFAAGVVPIIPTSAGIPGDLQGLPGAPWVIYALAAYWLYRNSRQSTA